MARSIRQRSVKAVPLIQAQGHLPRWLREAVKDDIVITRRGRPVGVLIGFATDEDWFAFRVERDPGFPQRIERAQHNTARAGRRNDVEEK
jgi:prevent-host-death family protein